MTKKIGILFLLLSATFALAVYLANAPTSAERAATSYGMSLDELNARFDALGKNRGTDTTPALLKAIQAQSNKQQQLSAYFLLSVFFFMTGSILIAIGINAEEQKRQSIALADLLQNISPNNNS